MEKLPNPDFLKKKYDLHNEPDVAATARHAEVVTGEKVKQDPSSRIQNYLNRFTEITERENSDDREHGIEAIKRMLHLHNVIRPDDIPESYFENQARLACEQGHGDIEVTDQMRGQLTEVIIADQRSSLDTWVDYMASPDALYPDWLKYWSVRSILAIGEYDKEKKQFTKRSKGTTKPFPDLNREALAYVLDLMEKKYAKEDIDLDSLDEGSRTKLESLLKGENFAKLYAFAIEQVTPASQENLSNTQGQWVKYDQNTDHMPLVRSLQGHGTGWCTAGESTAKTQLQEGDFYVYYSNDQDGNPTIPRAAIRMDGDHIGEVRGIAEEQNLDPYIGDVVQGKIREFGTEGKVYEKRSQDMKMLTVIERKATSGLPLTRDNLIFLWELETPIEGFGYQKDPRINRLLRQRDLDEDMLTIFDCTFDQIASDMSRINEKTRAYNGPLQPGIFAKLQEYSIDHIYTRFPEGRIRRETIEIGGRTKEEYVAQLKEVGAGINDYAKDMFESPDFVTSRYRFPLCTIRLTVNSLFGDVEMHGTDEIYRRAIELGLDFCPDETGPAYRLGHGYQFMDERVRIALEKSDPDGGLYVFIVERDGIGLWLDQHLWGRSDPEWDSDHEFVFSLRKPTENKKEEDIKTT